MTKTSPLTRRRALASAAIALTAMAVTPAALAAPSPRAGSGGSPWSSRTPSEILASTPWKTTSALDQDGRRVALDDPAVASFVGWAYFSADGTYTMYALDDTPKLRGDWTVNADGSERWISAEDEAGNVLFERVVPITQLDRNTFTYRVVPVAGDPSVFYDIVHTRTNHVEPGSGDTGPGAHGGPHGSGEGGYRFNHGNAR